MKNLFIILLVSLSFNCFSQTQAEMNREAYAEFNKADKELNRVYQQILTEYQADTIFVENLKKSQRIWVKFRDAEMEMKFPKYKNHHQHYGSIHPMCRAFYLRELTVNRTETLQEWLTGIEEGDVCNGSVKTKDAQP